MKSPRLIVYSLTALVLILLASPSISASAETMAPLNASQLGSAPTLPLETSAIAIANGYGYTCLLTDGHGVKCWGWNKYGQLGDATNIDHYTPMDVSGQTNGVSMIAGGIYHVCALLDGGSVKCWGNNGSGQLGDGTTSNQNTPVIVGGLSNVKAIAAGIGHTCALLNDGTLKCWGWNNHGQLGDNTTTTRPTPVPVIGLSGTVKAIAAGMMHTCALTTGGGVQCWGYNSIGQVGDNTTTDRHTPVNVSGLTSGVSAIAVGGFSCALTTSGGVKCWGASSVGDGTTTARHTPVDVSGLTGGVSRIDVGEGHACAVTTAGSIKCWGANDYAQLGDGTLTRRLTPINVSGLPVGISAVAAGTWHTCALGIHGGIKCWGSNTFGELGDGTVAVHFMPGDVSGLTSGVQKIAAGSEYTCALTSGGAVQCWGNNAHGQLGDNTTTVRLEPVLTTGLTGGMNGISALASHTCAWATGGGAKCWGYNFYGQVGDNTTTDRYAPIDIGGLTNVSQVSAGGSQTCALTGGGVKCWGTNSDGQLGDGTTTPHYTPGDVGTLTSGVQAIAVGSAHSCALTTGSGVKCWGDNGWGELGDGGTSDSSTPVDVSGLTDGVQAIAAGLQHTCALTTGGGVLCWGNGYYGQLGNGMSSTASNLPVQVNGLTNGVQAIFAGGNISCALMTGGTVKCWGMNWYGGLGDGTTTDRNAPVDVVGLSNVETIAIGSYHTCAVVTGGGVKCWGWNNLGQLGDGTRHFIPVNVTGFTLIEYGVNYVPMITNGQ